MIVKFMEIISHSIEMVSIHYQFSIRTEIITAEENIYNSKTGTRAQYTWPNPHLYSIKFSFQLTNVFERIFAPHAEFENPFVRKERIL